MFPEDATHTDGVAFYRMGRRNYRWNAAFQEWVHVELMPTYLQYLRPIGRNHGPGRNPGHQDPA